jgi:hypothetical protein
MKASEKLRTPLCPSLQIWLEFDATVGGVSDTVKGLFKVPL